jgi:hypothetical protein
MKGVGDESERVDCIAWCASQYCVEYIPFSLAYSPTTNSSRKKAASMPSRIIILVDFERAILAVSERGARYVNFEERTLWRREQATGHQDSGTRKGNSVSAGSCVSTCACVVCGKRRP